MSTEREGDTNDTTDETAEAAADHPRGRSARRSRLTVVAVAAAVLLAGGGGAYWAAAGGGSGGSSAGHGTPPPLALGGGPAGTYTASPADGAADQRYQLTGTLPAGPGNAPVYAVHAGVGEAAVARLAAALGLGGKVVANGGTWRVGGTGDGGGPALLVGKDAPGTWSYSLLGPGTKTAPGAGSAPGSPGDGGTGGTSAPRAGARSDGTAPVSERRAEAVAAPLFAKLGLSDARIDASRTVGAVRLVSADPVVGGLPTHGWATTVQVGADGALTLGYGRLAPLEKGPAYPVVSAAAALRQLNAHAPAVGSDGPVSCLVPVPKPRPEPRVTPQAREGQPGRLTKEGRDAGPWPGARPTEPGQDRTLPRSRPCVPGNGHPVQVRGAAFGLTAEFVSGAPALVPAWLFDTAQAGVAQTSVVAERAVDPAYVRQSPGAGEPVNPGGPVEPRPTTSTPADPGPGDGGPVAGRQVTVASYRANGTSVQLVFWGGVCSAYQATAAESAHQVRVSVTAKPIGGKERVCPMIAKSFTREVRLTEPLGARPVVDAATGERVKAAH